MQLPKYKRTCEKNMVPGDPHISDWDRGLQPGALQMLGAADGFWGLQMTASGGCW